MAPTDSGREPDLRAYLAVLRRRRGTIAFTLFAVVAGALAASYVQTPVYSSSASVLVPPRPSASASADADQTSRVDAERVLENEIQFAESDAVRAAVRDAARADASLAVSAEENADVLNFSARDRRPLVAAEVANLYAETYIELRRAALVEEFLASTAVIQAQIDALRLERDRLLGPLSRLQLALNQATDDLERTQIQTQIRLEEERVSGRRSSIDSQLASLEATAGELHLGPQLTIGAQVVREASPSTTPVRPTTTRNVLLALAVGSALGLGLAFMSERLDDSIRTRDDLEAATGLATLALIPRIPPLRQRGAHGVAVATDSRSPAAEAYRSLRTAILFRAGDRNLRTILVTSARGGEGKTTTAVNLAATMAMSGHRVLVVDGDLRRPMLHEYFRTSNDTGLSTAVANGQSLLDAATEVVVGDHRMWVLPSGPPPPNPSELLGSPPAARAFERLAARVEGTAGDAGDRRSAEVDYVLIDSSPVLPVTDAIVLSAHVDGVVLLASVATSAKRSTALAHQLLARVEAPLIGAVLNACPSEDGYGYEYGYEYVTTDEAPRRQRRRARRRERDGQAAATMPEPSPTSSPPGPGENVTNGRPATSATAASSTTAGAPAGEPRPEP